MNGNYKSFSQLRSQLLLLILDIGDYTGSENGSKPHKYVLWDPLTLHLIRYTFNHLLSLEYTQ